MNLHVSVMQEFQSLRRILHRIWKVAALLSLPVHHQLELTLSYYQLSVLLLDSDRWSVCKQPKVVIAVSEALLCFFLVYPNTMSLT